MKCEKCKAEFEAGGGFCPECGAKLPQKKKKPLWILFIIIPLCVILLGGILLLGLLAVGGTGVVLAVFGGKLFDRAPDLRPNADSSIIQTDENTDPLTPDCRGMLYSEALEELGDLGYVMITATYEYSEEVAKDCVIDQSVSPNDPVDPSGNINLVVSLGSGKSPTGYDQLIRVTAPEGSSKATLTLCVWEEGDWREVFSCQATVGKKGIGENYGEGRSVTPEGLFPLGFVLTGKELDVPHDFEEIVVTEDTCIVDDVDSPLYNTLQNISELPKGTGYDPLGSTILSGHTTACIYVEHNGDGLSSGRVISGDGSAITICGVAKLPKSTAGCIDISSADMEELLSILNDRLNPHIEIVSE